jgi:hypothetical protein
MWLSWFTCRTILVTSCLITFVRNHYGHITGLTTQVEFFDKEIRNNLCLTKSGSLITKMIGSCIYEQQKKKVKSKAIPVTGLGGM